MSLAWLACVAVTLVATPPQNALEIANARSTYGHLGAVRPKVGVLPGDVAHFAFEVRNLSLDAANKASFSIAIEIRDASGKLFYEQKPYNSVAQNFFGGNSLPCAAFFEIPLDAKPGPVDWKVTVVDRANKQAATVAGKGMILPADFGLVQTALFADAEARVPMSAVAVVGDAAFLRFSLVGFGLDKNTKQPNIKVSLRILDEKGDATAKPLEGTINSGVKAGDALLPMQYGITMNRAGRFTIELNAEDTVTGKRSQIRYALRVLPTE